MCKLVQKRCFCYPATQRFLLLLLGERRKETSAHNSSTSYCAYANYFSMSHMSCFILRNHIFSHFRVNSGELLEFRLFHRLIIRKTLQNFVKFYEVIIIIIITLLISSKRLFSLIYNFKYLKLNFPKIPLKNAVLF